nr:IS3 family transposase [Nocardia jiangxiensis]
MAGFIASQRTEHGVPHAVSCRALKVSESWFYKWNDRPVTPRQQRCDRLAGEIERIFVDSGRTYGSPRIGDELRAAGWRVSDNTVAKFMAGNGWTARKPPKRRSLTRQGKRPVARDLVRRQFTSVAPDVLWVGDVTEIPTIEGKLYLASGEGRVVQPDRRLLDRRPDDRRIGVLGTAQRDRPAFTGRHDRPFRQGQPISLPKVRQSVVPQRIAWLDGSDRRMR